MKGCRTGSSHFGVYGVWLEVGLDGLSESAGVQQTSGDAVVEVAVFLVKSVFRVSSLIFFGFRHEECRPVVCFTGCPSCRT